MIDHTCLINKKTPKVLDIGTGSGCIILSIIKERPKSYGTALDVSKKALEIAIYNAKMHHLENKVKFINMDVDKYNNNKYLLKNTYYRRILKIIYLHLH